MRLAVNRSQGRACKSRLRIRGATTIEFALALILGVLPLVLGILQVAALLAARNTIESRDFHGGPAGCGGGSRAGAMSRELARGLVPLYVPASRGGRDAGGSSRSGLR